MLSSAVKFGQVATARKSLVALEFTPANLPGLLLWLDGADAATFAVSDTDKVDSWADKSGNGNHAGQVTSGLRPTYDAALQNGQGGITSAGGAYLEIPGFLNIANATVMAVSSYDGTGSGSSIIGGSSTTSVLFLINGGGLSWDGAITAAIPDSSVMNVVGMTQASDNTVELFVNSATAAESQVLAGQSINFIRPGGYGSSASGYWLHGGICELIVCDQVLSAADMADVVSYLRGKWATP